MAAEVKLKQMENSRRCDRIFQRDEDDATARAIPRSGLEKLLGVTASDSKRADGHQEVMRYAMRRVFRGGAPQRTNPNDGVIVVANIAAQVDDTGLPTGSIDDMEILMVKESELK